MQAIALEPSNLRDTSSRQASVGARSVRRPAGRHAAFAESVLEGRIPGLDGLRGVCIVMVSLSHFAVAHNSPFPARFREARFLGGPAVDMFFVISGFLITLLLLRERERHGTISLPRFYARRALRILPAYAFFLIATAVLQRASLVSLDRRGWGLALTYTVNFVPRPPAWIGHVWSLSVEEHFYLAWPLVLVAWGDRAALRGLLLAIVGAVPVRCLLFGGYREWVDVDLLTFTRLDTIAVGCGLAFLVRDPKFRPLFDGIRRRPTWVAGVATVLLIVSVCVLSESGKYCLIVKRPLEAGLFATIIAAGFTSESSLLAAVLRSKVLVVLGALSYSLYLWQPLLHPSPEHWPYAWPVNVACLATCAVVSYFCVERPCLRLKRAVCASEPAGSRRVLEILR